MCTYLVYHAPGFLFFWVSVLQFNSVSPLIAMVILCLTSSCPRPSTHDRGVLTGTGGAACRQPGTGWAPTYTGILWPLLEEHTSSCRGTSSHCSWYGSWDLTWRVHTQSLYKQIFEIHTCAKTFTEDPVLNWETRCLFKCILCIQIQRPTWTVPLRWQLLTFFTMIKGHIITYNLLYENTPLPESEAVVAEVEILNTFGCEGGWGHSPSPPAPAPRRGAVWENEYDRRLRGFSSS